MESIQVIFVPKGSLDIMNRTNIASVFFIARGLRLQHMYSEEM